MDHIDLAGWSAPDGADVSSFVHIVRGQETMIERLVIEVPTDRNHVLGDVTIGKEPIVYGGQIADCITVKLIRGAALANVNNAPHACTSECCIDPANAISVDRPQIALGAQPQ
ncbi:MAG TPA: hypothetical protein VFB22_04960 [Candidatus Baltobacteraceae bacterium]|nr:hypothetical protein [Candidatus Baltobacteraceae bacterium]